MLGYRAQDLYQLVHDVERYPEFLPGCVSARIESRQHAGQTEVVRARLGFRAKGLSDSFVTENHAEPGRRIEMRLVEGPFKRLHGFWEFQPLAENACKVRLVLELEFGSRLLEAGLSPWIDRAVGSVLDAFVQRARALLP